MYPPVAPASSCSCLLLPRQCFRLKCASSAHSLHLRHGYVLGLGRCHHLWLCLSLHSTRHLGGGRKADDGDGPSREFRPSLRCRCRAARSPLLSHPPQALPQQPSPQPHLPTSEPPSLASLRAELTLNSWLDGFVRSFAVRRPRYDRSSAPLAGGTYARVPSKSRQCTAPPCRYHSLCNDFA